MYIFFKSTLKQFIMFRKISKRLLSGFLFFGSLTSSLMGNRLFVSIDHSFDDAMTKEQENQFFVDAGLGLGDDSQKKVLSTVQKHQYGETKVRLGGSFKVNESISGSVRFVLPKSLNVISKDYMKELSFVECMQGTMVDGKRTIGGGIVSERFAGEKRKVYRLSVKQKMKLAKGMIDSVEVGLSKDVNVPKLASLEGAGLDISVESDFVKGGIYGIYNEKIGDDKAENYMFWHKFKVRTNYFVRAKSALLPKAAQAFVKDLGVAFVDKCYKNDDIEKGCKLSFDLSTLDMKIPGLNGLVPCSINFEPSFYVEAGDKDWIGNMGCGVKANLVMGKDGKVTFTPGLEYDKEEGVGDDYLSLFSLKIKFELDLLKSLETNGYEEDYEEMF